LKEEIILKEPQFDHLKISQPLQTTNYAKINKIPDEKRPLNLQNTSRSIQIHLLSCTKCYFS
jgi:hypothetical protein